MLKRAVGMPREVDQSRALVLVASRLLALTSDPLLEWHSPHGREQAARIARELLMQAAR